MSFTGTLLPYQHAAVEKMVDRRQVLVAYDLGLGKTVLTIAAVESIRELEPEVGLTLVVCLSSLKYQWAKEIHKFTDKSALVIDGTRKQRDEQYASISDTTSTPVDYIVVNYEQVVNDWQEISAIPCSTLILDEATAIKSFRSKRSKRVKELSRNIDNRFGLTGTPIENGRPEELYSIMQAIDSSVLGQRFDLFDATFIVRNKFGGVERYRNLPKLHSRIQTASVRKAQTDPDVAPFLPDTIHRDPLLVPLDRYSARIYRLIANELATELAEVSGSYGGSFNVDAHYGNGSAGGFIDEARGRIMSKITALRMLCDDPELLVTSASKYDPFGSGAIEGSKYLAELLSDDSVMTMITRAKANKLDILKGVVSDHLMDDLNKVVIFTSFVGMASKIRDAVGGVVYTGQMSAREKEDAKVSFQTDPNIRCLVSTDAGGYGVDLPQANLLINYDLPWSSGLAVQRNGRIKRASSKWPSIIIQDLLISESIEVRLHDVLRQKDAVAAAVVDGKGINTRGGVDLTAGSLLSFLDESQP